MNQSEYPEKPPYTDELELYVDIYEEEEEAKAHADTEKGLSDTTISVVAALGGANSIYSGIFVMTTGAADVLVDGQSRAQDIANIGIGTTASSIGTLLLFSGTVNLYNTITQRKKHKLEE